MEKFYSLETYDYHLPKELIAQVPVEPRDSSRLLVIDRENGKWEHRIFRDLPDLLRSNDVLVANNTKVMKARLLGRRILEKNLGGSAEFGGGIEFLMLEKLGSNSHIWEGAFRASAKHKLGIRFYVPTEDGKGLYGEIIRGASGSSQGTVVVEFDRDPLECGAGKVPLPPYIERSADLHDLQTYQTTYSKHLGSAAAPTAGFHFTDELIRKLCKKGILWEEITLHVGLGTFRPVKSTDIRLHPMHEEVYEVSEKTCLNLTRAKNEKRRLIAVGTTTVRTLENGIRPGIGRTSIFIHPKKEAQGGSADFSVIDGMITNFHLPKSTLFMLVCAFGGTELIQAAYQEAVREKYRFYSYGDAMLVV